MKRILCSLVVVCLAVAVAPKAAAHRLVPDDGSHTTSETAIFLDDVDLSQVVYHEVSAESNHLWLSFDGVPGENLYWQLGVPVIEGLEDYRPTVVVLGPGLPEVQVPFTIPEGVGGIVVDTEGMPNEFFDERFTGTEDWIIHAEEGTLEQAGRYYIVAYHPDGTPGKFWLAIGRREEFGLADILSYADVLAFVREYHEVQGQPLPFLPRLLLMLSRVMRLVFSLFMFA